MKVIIKPSKARGEIYAPPSKSMAHRLLICAGLTNGISTVSNIAFSQDILATLDCLKTLGADYSIDGSTVTVKGTNPSLYHGENILNCRECGSTLRFMIPLCMTGKKEVKLTGSTTLMERPLTVYSEIAKSQNLKYELNDGILSVCGALTPGEYVVTGSISSQFISGLLFTLPLLNGTSTLKLIPPVESRPYIDMTLQALSLYGIEVEEKDENTFLVKGNQQYKPCNTSVEGDYSNAAFLEALNFTGGPVEVKGLNPHSLQGDKIYMEMYKKLRGGNCSLDISDCPDLGPVLFSVAALCDGAEFTGTKRLKWKESDRALAMKHELEKCGISVAVEENRVIVNSGELKKPKEIICSHNDHRIAMSMVVVLTRIGGIIDCAEAVRKSYPDFFEHLKSLGVEVETYGMDK